MERLDRSLFSVVKEPFPELGDSLSGVIVSLGIDQHVRVQEVDHGPFGSTTPRLQQGVD